MIPLNSDKIRGAIEAKKLEVEQNKIATKIADKIGVVFEVKIAELLKAFEQLIDHTKELGEKVEAIKLEVPAKQRIEGIVKVDNPDDFKKEVQKVEVLNPLDEVKVKNQISLEPLREDLSAMIRAAESLVGEEHFKNTKQIEELREFLKKISVKQDAELLAALRPLRYLSNDPTKPISVRLSDGEKFYRAIEQVVYAASGGGTDLTQVITLLNQILAAITGGGAGIYQHNWSEQTCVPATEKVLATLTATSGKTLTINGIICEGIDDGLFKVYVGTAAKWQWRNAWTERGINASFDIRVPSGQTVELRATNLKPVNRIFSGGLYGYEL